MFNKPTSTSYLDAGFNRFFSRSITSSPDTNSLQAISRASGSNTINFDHYQTSGSLGDKIQVGGVTIDGTNRRIVITDESNNEIGWIGNIDG